MMCDKHISKMTLETAQMLCTVAVSLGFTNEFLYKSVHPKHPCTIWAGKCLKNWEWLCQHGLALGDEFFFRYERNHKSRAVISNIYELRLGPKNGFRRTAFAQAMPEQYKVKGNAVRAYRQYYIHEKARFAKWRAGNVPNWWPHAA